MSRIFKIISEALNDEQKETVRRWPDRLPAVTNYIDHYFGKGVEDKFEKLEGTQDKSEIHKAVERHLGSEIHPDDYKAGMMKDKYNRPVKIGSALAKAKAPPHLINSFANDNTRQGTKFTGLTVHTTRSKEGVAGQTSGGQSWEDQSCKNFANGMNRHYLQPEYRSGTVVSYLKDHTGKELARATFQPHHPISDLTGAPVYKQDSYYGIDHAGFRKHNETTEKNLSHPYAEEDGVFQKHSEVYNNDGKMKTLNPNISEHQLRDIITHKGPSMYGDAAKSLAFQHPKTPSDLIDSEIKKSYSDYTRAILANPNLTDHHLHMLIKPKTDASYDTQNAATAFQHKNIKPEHIDVGMSSPTPRIRRAAVGSSNITHDQLMSALKDPDVQTHQISLYNPRSTRKHAEAAFSDPKVMENEGTASFVMMHKHATPSMLRWGIDHQDTGVRANAAGNPNAPTDVLDKAVRDPDPFLRNQVINHPNATAEHTSLLLGDHSKSIKKMTAKSANLNNQHIHQIINDPDTIVDDIKQKNVYDKLKPEHVDHILDKGGDHSIIAALNHPTAVQPHHIDRALNHSFPWVRATAAKLAKSGDQLDKAQNDSAFDVRLGAISNPHASEKHIMRALNDSEPAIRRAAKLKATPKMLKSLGTLSRIRNALRG